MSRHSRFARSAALFGVLLITPALALAQNRERSAEVGLAATFTHFDTQTGLGNRVSPSVLVGYNFTKRHGAELVFNSQTATPRAGDSFRIDVDTLRLGYLFNAYPKEKIVSFFRLGLGWWNIDPEPHSAGSSQLEEGDTAFMLYSGGGVRWFVTPRVGIRLAATVDFIDRGSNYAHPDIQATGDLGVVFVLGGREPTEKPEEPEKPAEPTAP